MPFQTIQFIWHHFSITCPIITKFVVSFSRVFGRIASQTTPACLPHWELPIGPQDDGIWFSGCGDIVVFAFEADGILIRPYLLIHGMSLLHFNIIGKPLSRPVQWPHVHSNPTSHRSPIVPSLSHSSYPHIHVAFYNIASLILGSLLHHIHLYPHIKSYIIAHHSPPHFHQLYDASYSSPESRDFTSLLRIRYSAKLSLAKPFASLIQLLFDS